MKNEVEKEAVMSYINVGLYTRIGAAELRKIAKMLNQYIWSSTLWFFLGSCPIPSRTSDYSEVKIELHAFSVITRILYQTRLPSTYKTVQRFRGIGNIEVWHLTMLSMA